VLVGHKLPICEEKSRWFERSLRIWPLSPTKVHFLPLYPVCLQQLMWTPSCSCNREGCTIFCLFYLRTLVALCHVFNMFLWNQICWVTSAVDCTLYNGDNSLLIMDLSDLTCYHFWGPLGGRFSYSDDHNFLKQDCVKRQKTSILFLSVTNFRRES
jgi:hypothetical protein